MGSLEHKKNHQLKRENPIVLARQQPKEEVATGVGKSTQGRTHREHVQKHELVGNGGGRAKRRKSSATAAAQYGGKVL